jgi:opacity protein-like surface antigen
MAVVVGAALPAPTSSQPYVKAGIALDWTQGTRFQDEAGDDNGALKPESSLGDFGTMAGLELGLGYVILPALRLEAAVQYRPDFSFKGRANFAEDPPEDSLATAKQDVSATLAALSGMLAAYLDVPLPGLGLLRYTPVNPFIGVGGGLSLIDIGKTRLESPETSMIVPGDEQVNFSWMVSAGLSVWLGGRLTVDAAWRYMDHGTIENASGKGKLVWRDQSRPQRDLDLGKTRGDLRGHGLTVSVRYAF